MNIFYLDKNPTIAAEMMVDKHVVKMILETAQLLSTAHRILDGTEVEGRSATGRKAKRWILPDGREQIMYMATHINHPSAVWCRKSVENYIWLADHLEALLKEYTYRYGKVHKVASSGLAYSLYSPPLSLEDYSATPMLCAMDTSFIISEDPVENYRNYYKTGKVHLHSWTRREKPSWM